MKEFHGIAKKGNLELSLTQLKQREAYLSSLKDDTRVIETLRKEGKSKSWEQVKCHWGLVISTILSEFDSNGWDCSILYNLPKPTGVPVNRDMLHQFFYALFPTYVDGRLITMSDDEWTTVHSSNFFENVRNFAASQWSIYIPDPNPNWKENNDPERKNTE